ncbi:MAG: hypothetical protein CVU81_00720, partial [Euryarchaeota archaeon HGW-Euryarchaeota-1]
MDDVAATIETQKILIAHAPTGIGKTVSVLAPAVKYAVKNNKIVFFLTSKQSQHKIVIETLKKMSDKADFEIKVVDVVSKQAMCPREIASEHPALFSDFCHLDQKTGRCKYFTKDNDQFKEKIRGKIFHIDEFKKLCLEEGICPHKCALELIPTANVVVCDYNYLFTDIFDNLADKTGKSLDDFIVIVDEAHNLPPRLIDYLSGELNIDILDEARKEAQKIDRKDLAQIIKKIIGFFEAQTKNKETNVTKEFLIDRLDIILKESLTQMSFDSFFEEIEKAADEAVEQKVAEDYSKLNFLKTFLEGWKTSFPCSRIFSFVDSPKLSYKLLDPSLLSSKILMAAHSAILMSGTLSPPEMYAGILGITDERAIFKIYTSPFPQENKLVIVTKNLTSLYSQRGKDMFYAMAEKITNISKVVIEETGQNVAVFFPSYLFLNEVQQYVGSDIKSKLIVESKNMRKADKENLYNQLKFFPGKVLFGVLAGSLSEGFDYENNILKCVIVVGLPLTPPSLFEKNFQEYYCRKFGRQKGMLYSSVYPAINKAIQAGGRAIRSETDRAFIVLMDYRYIFSEYKQCLPPEWDVKSSDKVEAL